MLSFEEVNERIWDIESDIFIPAAASKLVSEDQISRLISNGLEMVSAGANVPFKGDDVFFGDTADFADQKLAYVPDFIANCGMARTFAYLMEQGVEISDEKIFFDVSNTIKTALKQIHKEDSSGVHLSELGLLQALRKLA